jgi:hypothetical protein
MIVVKLFTAIYRIAYNGKANRITRANKNIMLTLKKSIEENKVKIVKL